MLDRFPKNLPLLNIPLLTLILCLCSRSTIALADDQQKVEHFVSLTQELINTWSSFLNVVVQRGSQNSQNSQDSHNRNENEEERQHFQELQFRQAEVENALREMARDGLGKDHRIQVYRALNNSLTQMWQDYKKGTEQFSKALEAQIGNELTCLKGQEGLEQLLARLNKNFWEEIGGSFRQFVTVTQELLFFKLYKVAPTLAEKRLPAAVESEISAANKRFTKLAKKIQDKNGAVEGEVSGCHGGLSGLIKKISEFLEGKHEPPAKSCYSPL